MDVTSFAQLPTSSLILSRVLSGSLSSSSSAHNAWSSLRPCNSPCSSYIPPLASASFLVSPVVLSCLGSPLSLISCSVILTPCPAPGFFGVLLFIGLPIAVSATPSTTPVLLMSPLLLVPGFPFSSPVSFSNSANAFSVSFCSVPSSSTVSNFPAPFGLVTFCFLLSPPPSFWSTLFCLLLILASFLAWLSSLSLSTHSASKGLPPLPPCVRFFSPFPIVELLGPLWSSPSLAWSPSRASPPASKGFPPFPPLARLFVATLGWLSLWSS